MNRPDYKLLSLLTVLAVLAPTVIGLSLGWPWWAWLIIMILLISTIVMSDRQIRHRREQERLRRQYEEHRPSARIGEPATVRYALGSTPLASTKADYDFIFSCTMNWRPTQHDSAAPYGDPRAIASDHIIGRAAAAASAESPTDRVFAQHRLAAALSYPEPDPSGRLLVWADDVVLAVPDADANRLRQLADLRKQEELWEQNRAFERNVRTYLGTEVLKDTGSAVVWWLAKNSDQVKETAQLIGTMAELSAAANNTEVHELFRHLVPSEHLEPRQPAPSSPRIVDGLAFEQGTNGSAAAHIHDFLPGFDDNSAMFGHQLADLLARHNEHSRADRVRNAYTAAEPGPTTMNGTPDEADAREVD